MELIVVIQELDEMGFSFGGHHRSDLIIGFAGSTTVAPSTWKGMFKTMSWIFVDVSLARFHISSCFNMLSHAYSSKIFKTHRVTIVLTVYFDAVYVVV